MSIWTQLAQDSARDRELLNTAMGLLYIVRANQSADPYLLEKIKELEAAVVNHVKHDHRFRNSTVAFDLNEYPRKRDD